MGAERRFYRLLTLEDIPELEAASAYLFAFDPQDLRLSDIIQDERWFCLAAVASPRPGVEQIVGFVAAAVGRVGEFSQEALFLQQTLCQAGGGSSSGSSSSAQLPGSLVDETVVSGLASTSSSNGGSSSADNCDSNVTSAAAAAADASAAADALAVEVVLLGVVSSYRRQGVASRLLQQVKRHARSQGASLMFLHVQDTNKPARQLYTKAGFAQVATLEGYYSRQFNSNSTQHSTTISSSSSSSSSWWVNRGAGALAMPMQDIAAQASQAGPAAAAAALQSGTFSGIDAQLLVMLLNKPEMIGVESDADMAEQISSSNSSRTNSSSSSSTGLSDTKIDMSDWPPLRLPSSMRNSNSSSSSESPGTPSSAPQDAAEAAAGAAAAAASVVLGSALRLLTGGLFGRPRGGAGNRGGLVSGRLGKVVDLGGELMVEVREGSDVVLLDPDELPADVVLSDRDKTRLRQRQQWQQLMRNAGDKQQAASAAAAAAAAAATGGGDEGMRPCRVNTSSSDNISSSSGQDDDSDGGGGASSSGSSSSSTSRPVSSSTGGSNGPNSSTLCSSAGHNSSSSSSRSSSHQQAPAVHLLHQCQQQCVQQQWWQHCIILEQPQHGSVQQQQQQHQHRVLQQWQQHQQQLQQQRICHKPTSRRSLPCGLVSGAGGARLGGTCRSVGAPVRPVIC